MIEEARGRKRRIDAELGTDQGRIGGDTHSLQKCSKQSVLVFAIAIAIRKHIRSGVGSITAQTQIDTDVTVARGDKIIERMKFLVIGSLSFSQVIRLGSNFRADCSLGLYETSEPPSNLVPRRKRRKLDVRRNNAVIVLFPLGNFRFFELLQICGPETVDPAITIIAGRRLGLRIAQLHGWTFRDVDFQSLFQADTSVEIRVIEPEVPGRHRLVNGPVKMGF